MAETVTGTSPPPPSPPDTDPPPPRRASRAGRGAVAGIVGATAMVLWFLLIDAIQGEPLRTPAFLAGALLGDPAMVMSAGPILLFTVVHYAAWILTGVLVAWILSRIRAPAPLLLGLVLGFLLFDLVFYGSVVVTGADVVAELGWPPVLIGNLLAGLAVLAFLHRTAERRETTWLDHIAHHRVVREGLVSGVIGALVVAAWFLAFDLMLGAPLFTPGALGSALFLGAESIAEVQVSGVTVLGYSIIHLALFVLVGLIAAGVVAAAEETPPLIFGAMLFFAAYEAMFMGLLAVIAEFLLGELAWWTIAVGNVLAAAVMGLYLWQRHPGLRAAVTSDMMERDV